MNGTSLKVDTFGITDIGLSRSNNEDVWMVLPNKLFYILADGMGGHKAGEVAASIAVQGMCETMNTLSEEADIEETCQLLREGMAKVNTKVYSESRLHPDYSGMGTTLTGFVIVGRHLIYAHIGDSRLYRYRHKLDLLTQDHSLRNAPPSGDISASQMRNVITRAIGTLPTILPDIGVIPLKSKDIYMICSDGLSDYVDKDKIAYLLSTPLPLEEIGKKLVRAALEKGGNDNITLLLVRLT